MDTPDDPPRAAPRGDPTTAAQRVKKKANQEAHDAELREQKAAADQEVVQPFLDGLMGLPTMNPKAKGRAARFHPAEDVRWSAVQRLLDSLEERDPLLYRQVFLHMLGVSGNRTKPYGEISSRTTKGDRSTTLLKVLHTLACFCAEPTFTLVAGEGSGDPVPMPKLSERRGMSGRFAADGKAVCIATKGTAAQANEEAESRGSAPSAQATAQEMAAALREDAVEGDDAGLSEEDQAAIRHDLAVAAGLDVEVSTDLAVEPVTTQPEAEPEAPPPSDGEDEEQGDEAEVGGASGKRRTCSVQVTQSLDHDHKRLSQRARQLALGAQKRTASKATSHTASGAAPQVAQKNGKKKKKK